MKLKKALRYIDRGIDVRLWYADNPSCEYKMWEGAAFNVPKKFKKYQLVKAKYNLDSEAIFPMANGKMRITIVKEQ